MERADRLQIDGLDAIRGARQAAGRMYEEFLRRPSMSAGLYELPAGSQDPQRPHDEDEVYYVIAGQAAFEGGGDVRPVGPGDVIFVAAGEPHRFVDIASDLSLLVVFAPAESSAT